MDFGTESQRNDALVCSGACALGCLGLLSKRPLAHIGASTSAAEAVLAGRAPQRLAQRACAL